MNMCSKERFLTLPIAQVILRCGFLSIAIFIVSLLSSLVQADAVIPIIAPAKLAALNPEQRAMIDALLAKVKIIPAGEFQIGDDNAENDDEQPARQIKLKSFGLLSTEVTFAQYEVFAQVTSRVLPDDQTWGKGERPVINVSWEDARDFALWLHEKTGLAWRLPTEAEWEYAARAGSKAKYSFGDQLADFCTYGNVADAGTTGAWRNKSCSDGHLRTAPVAQFKANAWGIYDMHGNVWEWVQDCWQSGYREISESGAANESGGCRERVQRGGSWFYSADDARAGYRSSAPFADKGVQVGFRVVLDVANK
jgi:formylglycine-generating enzyme required for sulfatase activity